MSRFISDKFKDLTPYVPGEQPKDLLYIKLNTNESPFPPSPYTLRLMRQAAGNLSLYPDPEYTSLTFVAAEKFGIDEDEILFTNGSDEALNFAFAAFCDQNTPAIFPDITYGFYEVFAKINRVPYEVIPLKADFSIDINDYINRKGTVFIANPNAPTGIYLSLDKIEKLVAANAKNIVVIDEAYIDFGGESAVSLIKKYDNLLITQTFSKSRSLAGARLGMVIGSAELIKDLKLIKYSTNPYNVSMTTASAGVGALLDTEYFEKNCEEIIATRENLKEQLKTLGFDFTDSKANFLFAKSSAFGGEELYLKLKEKGVLVRYFGKERIKDYVRITVGSKEETAALVAAISEIMGEKK